MRSLLKIGLTLVILLGAVIWVVRAFDAQKTRNAYRLAREELRSEFLASAPWVFGLEDPDLYRREIRGLLRWYLQRVEELDKRFPALSPPRDAYLEELEARQAAGRIDLHEAEAYRESYEQVAEVWAALADGSYAPERSGVGSGMRLDFLPGKPTLVEGQRAVRGRFVLWGAQRGRVEEDVAGVEATRIQTYAVFHDVQVELFDERGKPMGRMSFGLPYGTYVPVPEQRIDAFPPLAFVGDYAIPLVPHRAHTMEMKATVISRSVTGAEIRADFTWKEPVPSHWKLAEGEAWEGAQVGHREE